MGRKAEIRKHGWGLGERLQIVGNKDTRLWETRRLSQIVEERDWCITRGRKKLVLIEHFLYSATWCETSSKSGKRLEGLKYTGTLPCTRLHIVI